MLSVVEVSQHICRVRFASDLMVPHLLLADDSLFFCRAILGYLTYLKYIFDSYTIASGQ